jgi:O-antigen/teichoic acid export membrane protein
MTPPERALHAEARGNVHADASGLQQILVNGASLLGAYVLPRGLTFASALIAARELGPERFGAYGTAASFAIIVSIIGTLGMLPLLVRELARTPERALEVLSAAHIVKAGATLIMLILLLAIATMVLHYPTEIVISAALLGIGYVFSAFAENLGAYFQAMEQMHVWLESSIWFGLLSGVLGIVLVLLTHSVPLFCVAFACGQLGALLWLRRRMPHNARGWSESALADARRLLRAVLPFAAAFMALTIFYKVDVLLLERLQDRAVVGIYAAGYKLVDIVHALAVVASGAFYPRLARLGSKAERARPATRALELFLLAGVLGAGALWLIRTPLILFVFGPAYAPTADVLGLLAPALTALTISILAGYLLSAADHVAAMALAYAAAVALKIGLGLWLIPLWGATGMATAMLVAEFVLAALLLFTLSHYRVGAPRLSALALALGAAVLGAAVSRLPIAQPAVLLGIYLGAVLLWYAFGGALSKTERATLLHALRSRPQSS